MVQARTGSTDHCEELCFYLRPGASAEADGVSAEERSFAPEAEEDISARARRVEAESGRAALHWKQLAARQCWDGVMLLTLRDAETRNATL